MLKFKTSCAVLANLSSNLLNEVGLSLFRYFEVGLRVCDIVVNKYVRYLISWWVLVKLSDLEVNSWRLIDQVIICLILRYIYLTRADACCEKLLFEVLTRVQFRGTAQWIAYRTKKLSSIEDRGQTDRVTALPHSHTFDVDLWPWPRPITLTFNPRRAMVMTLAYMYFYRYCSLTSAF